MRILELLILASLLPSFAGFFVTPQRRPRWLLFLPALGVSLIALHLPLEGYRWQMVPAYALTALFMLSATRALSHKDRAFDSSPSTPLPSRKRTAFRISGAVAGVLVFGLSVLIPAALPVFELPEPTGPFAVGTTRFSLPDSSRPETFTIGPSDKRELLIQSWYPAEPTRWCGDDARFVRRGGEVAIPTTDPGLADNAELDCDQFPVVWRAPADPDRVA